MSFWNPMDAAQRALALGKQGLKTAEHAAKDVASKAASGLAQVAQEGLDLGQSGFDAAKQGATGAWDRFSHAVERGVISAGDDGLRTVQNLSLDLRQRSRHPTLGTPNPTAGVGRPPVILLGGQGDDATRSMKVYADSLERDGFNVFVFDDPGRAMESHGDASAQLDRLVERVRQQTGAKKVDLVGYSTGGTNARAYVNLYGGADKVGRVVQLAGTNNGDPTALDCCASGLEEKKGSAFMEALNAHPAEVPVYSLFEKGTDGEVQQSDAQLTPSAWNHNVPLEQARAGGGNFVVNDHTSLPFDARAYDAVVAALTQP